MRQKISHVLSILLVSILIIGGSFSSYGSLNFTDIKASEWFYTDVMTLVDRGIISGYEDHTFRPASQIKVSEFIKLTVVAAGIDVQDTLGRYWYSPYVDAAVNADIIDIDYFDNYNRNISRGEMADIISRLLKLEETQDQEVILGYASDIKDYASIKANHRLSVLQVYGAGIITGYEDGNIRSDFLATRAEAATVIIRMLDESRRKLPNPTLAVAGYNEALESDSSINQDYKIKGIYVGMERGELIQALGNPKDTYISLSGYDTYVYYDDYSWLLFVELNGQKVVSIASNTDLRTPYGISIGSSEDIEAYYDNIGVYGYYLYVRDGDLNIKYYSDEKVTDGISGVLIRDKDTDFTYNYTWEALRGQEAAMFHLTNSERVEAGQDILSYSFQAYDAAYKHSVDMAEHTFGHTGSDGSQPRDRMTGEGIQALYWAENVAGGYSTGMDMHFGFMFSEAHRINKLSDRVEYVGIAIYVDESSKYTYYVTENYYEPK